MDNVDFARFVFAFLFVIGLIGAAGFLLKRVAGTSKWMGTQQDTDRIQVVQTRYLDAKRKVVLIRRDNKEHLLLLADGQALVIEANIESDVHA